MSLRRTLSCLVVGSMLFMLCGRVFAVSQEELTEMSASGLLAEATKVLSAENYGLAIPYLTEYLDRMKATEDDRVLALMQEVRLKLGKLLSYLENPLGAVEHLKQYTEKLPLYKPREAYKLLAVNLYGAGRYEECIAAANYALTRPLPKDLPKKEKKVNYDELSKDELGGLTARQIKRYEKQAKELEADLAEGFSEKAPDLVEPDYTVEDLVLLNMTLAEACSAQQAWENSLAPYQFVIENVADDARRGYAIMQTVNALVALERFKEAGAFVLKLSRTNARYDIRVNMALMKSAAALAKAGEHDSALLLYRMVLPREDLVTYQEGKMNEMRRNAGLPDVEIKVVTNETGRVETLFGHKKSNFLLQSSSSKVTEGTLLPPKPVELLKLEELVLILLALPPYENEVLYRTGALYADAGRPWEAVAALSIVAARDPDSELGLRAFAESLQVLVDPLKEYERVETLAMKFLESHKEGLGPRMVAHALTGCYQKQERWKDIKKLLPVIEGFVPSEDRIVRQYECELHYMQAIADLMLFNYPQALADFNRVLTEFPGSHQQENAMHWHAMSQLFLKNYLDAQAEFAIYRADYPNGTWMPEATFNSGICFFGLEKNTEAQQQFSEVISKYPESSVYSDACSLRGDILASQGRLDEAQRDYETAITSARNPKQDTYAVFQMVSMFSLESRYPEMITVIEAYLDRRGEAGDVAKAGYWIGKIKLAQGLMDEAVKAYLDIIVKYGGNILQDGVDLIIEELTKVAKRLKDEPRHQLEERLRADADAAVNETLKLRLQVLLARINGTELELGRKLIAEQSDLTQAPPPVLAVICKASFAAGDYSRAQEILAIFQGHFEDSDFMRAAYKLRGYDLFLAGDLDGAMKIVAEAQGLYGTQADAAWAQLMKGRIELQRKEFDAARKTFRDLLNVREWRGEAYAEATYYLGEVEEKAGDPRQAFAWYQRVYFQYKGYAKGTWAADGYLASARCLQKLGLENDRRNTYRAMLFDKYVNTLPQADEAKAILGVDEVLEITTLLAQGVQTNIVVTVEAEGAL